MNKFKIRLTAIFIALLALSVLAAGVFSAQMLKRSHLDELRETLSREGQIIRTFVDWRAGLESGDPYRYFSEIAASLKSSANARVTFIRGDGIVVGDSDYDARRMENHANREEIVMARETGLGTSIRHSETTGLDMLYVAVPLAEGSQPEGYLRLAVSLENVERTIRDLWTGLIAGLGVLFLAAALISYRAAQGLTRPLEKITRVAHQIANMNYKARVRIRNKDEIGQLGQAINSMADSLQLQLNRIREEESRLKSVLETMASGVVMIDREGRVVLMNRSAEDILGFQARELMGKRYADAQQQSDLVHLVRECLERKESLREEVHLYFPQERIVEAHLVPMPNDDDGGIPGILMVLHDITAIRRLEKVRSEFVANVSHELKTPIAAVKGFAETLLAGAMNDPETARSFLQIIFDESERLNRLIGDILELSKIESRRIPLQFSPIHLPEFVSKTIDMMRAAADKKRIALDMDVTEDLYVEADEDRLRQILINLLSNGINYSPEGGRVSVRAEPADTNASGEYERVRISVEDTGIGIPKKDLPRIFERFYRVDKARSRSSGGTGLGLSIVKHLVELHRGTIRVESELGIGSRFILELPVVQ